MIRVIRATLGIVALAPALCLAQKADSASKKKPADPAKLLENCLLYTSPSPRDRQKSRMPSSA